ncbi:MAG TPA: SAM-dependent methyltransferase [Chthoniobacterales bacterium]|nr:SAM-dependent methyltransferase [Chthoniobacterales bacterium]
MKTTGNQALIEFIRCRIERDGPQPFAWFMQQALYHSEFGYYSSDRALIGRDGDYFSNVSVGPLFAQLLAAQIHEIWERFGKIDNFIVVEQGAHHGEFARDFLEWIAQKLPHFFAAVRYRIVEPFPKLQDRQAKTLEDFIRHVQWQATPDDLEPFVGVHFSNELLDSMPINLQGKLVGVAGNDFIFVPSSAPQARNQSQLDWVGQISARVQRGIVLVVDYGFAGPEFRQMLQVRAKHRLLDSPFEEIGTADITSHIDWTGIAAHGRKRGLEVCGFTDQHHFLTGIISSFPEMLSDEKSKRGLQTLLHPEMLGRSFQVLGLAKDVGFAPPLAGFKFARPAIEQLGL